MVGGGGEEGKRDRGGCNCKNRMPAVQIRTFRAQVTVW